MKITNAAAQQILFLMKQEKICQGIKIKIKKSGCAGFKYELQLSKKKNHKETSITIKKITFFIEKKWVIFLTHLKIDFIKNKLNYNFTFQNTNAVNICGCGESFNI